MENECLFADCPARMVYHPGMFRLIALFALSATLAGCDLVGTTAATAAGASAEVKQAQQAKKIEQQVQDSVQMDMQRDRARAEQAEKEAQ